MSTSEDFFEELKIQLDKQLPFVAYKDPSGTSSEVKALLQKDSQLHKIQDYTESGFVFAPFDADNIAVIIPAKYSSFLETPADIISTVSGSEIRKQVEEDEAEKEQHQKLVKKAVEEINNAAFKKVVLSRKEIIETEANPIQLFQDLLRKYQTAFIYIWFHPKTGLWLGATPETLLKVNRDKFVTMALAGTQKFVEHKEVSWGEKEREEQQIVVDAILDNLEKASAKNIKYSEAYTSRAGTLLHLRTDITGSLDSKLQAPNSKSRDLEKLIKAIHPTPAVCGLPKEPAKEFILKNENYDREFYTGFLGELNLKSERKRSTNRRNQENQAYGSVSISSALYVNLRCMKLEGNRATIFVGGGITQDSNPEAEWEETKNKAETMKAVLIRVQD